MRATKLEIVGEASVTALRAGDEEIPCQCVFLLRHAIPPTDLLPALELENGYIRVDREMRTNLPGVFAAGDIRKKSLRQVVTAAADGAIAAVQAEKYLRKSGLI